MLESHAFGLRITARLDKNTSARYEKAWGNEISRAADMHDFHLLQGDAMMLSSNRQESTDFGMQGSSPKDQGL